MDEFSVNLLKRANIDVNNIKNTVQVLNFDDKFKHASDITLVELDNDLLKVMEEDTNISFRGDKKEQLVFCSKDKTYDVKIADISNSILLMPNLKICKEIDQNKEKDFVMEHKYLKGIYQQYFEMKQCPPKLSKLITVLEPSTFKGLEFEKTIKKEDLYDWNRLISTIQASDAEITSAFVDYMIADIKGYFRMVSFEFEARALTLMLDFVDENSWKPDEVDKKYTYDELSKFIPKSVFDLIFHKYTVSTNVTDTGLCLYKYDEESCCKLLARVLLTACPVSEYKHFMQAWNLGTPEYMKPKPEYLHGTAIVVYNSSKMKNEVLVFPEMNLPDNIEDRFTELFKAKSKWTLEEISPYLKKLCTSKINVNALLTKYARSSTIKDVKYYSSKHDK